MCLIEAWITITETQLINFLKNSITAVPKGRGGGIWFYISNETVGNGSIQVIHWNFAQVPWCRVKKACPGTYTGHCTVYSYIANSLTYFQIFLNIKIVSQNITFSPRTRNYLPKMDNFWSIFCLRLLFHSIITKYSKFSHTKLFKFLIFHSFLNSS